MRTVLEGYDYDGSRFVEEREWDGDVFDVMADKWRPILAREGEAWRLLLMRGDEVERVEYLSRPEGF